MRLIINLKKLPVGGGYGPAVAGANPGAGGTGCGAGVGWWGFMGYGGTGTIGGGAAWWVVVVTVTFGLVEPSGTK